MIPSPFGYLSEDDEDETQNRCKVSDRGIKILSALDTVVDGFFTRYRVPRDLKNVLLLWIGLWCCALLTGCWEDA